MMPPEQIEVAARTLCEMRAADPDQVIPVRDQAGVLLVGKTIRLWQMLAPEIVKHLQVTEAIAKAEAEQSVSTAEA